MTILAGVRFGLWRRLSATKSFARAFRHLNLSADCADRQAGGNRSRNPFPDTPASARWIAVALFCTATAIVSPAQTLTTLYSFCHQINCPDGMTPYAPVVQATDGNFYGTASVGGDHQIGTAFKITPAGVLTVLHSFGSGGDGSIPYGGVIQASDGNFYGTTQAQGTGGRGTVFQMTPAGELTTLHNFTGADGSKAYGQLVQGSDGNFYGTTSAGGSTNGGTVFQMTPSGTVTTLYAFCQQVACADGLSPYAGLVQGTDGNFYGTTLGGGTHGSNGTVFQITASGVLTTLYSFDNTDGANPYAPLVQGSDGNFYGTVSKGGPQNYGAIFKITSAGDLTVLHMFTGGTQGYGPTGGLLQASDGNFYGTTYLDGGTIFRMTPDGTYTALHRFSFTDGGFPYSGVIQGTDGSLYSTTTAGGAYSEGTVFSLSLASLISTTTALTSAPNPSDLGQSVTMTATVTAQDGSNPTGTVAFTSNGASIGSATLNWRRGGSELFGIACGYGPSGRDLSGLGDTCRQYFEHRDADGESRQQHDRGDQFAESLYLRTVR